MHFLLVQDSDEIRDRLDFWLENTYEAEVTTTTDSESAMAALDHGDKRVDLVIFDYQKNAIKKLRRFQKKLGRIPCVLCLPGMRTEGIEKTSTTHIIDRNDLIGNLSSLILQLQGSGIFSENQEAEENAEDFAPDVVDREFCRIKTKLLLSTCPLDADVFIRLSPRKFLKLFREGDEFNKYDYQKYTESKGIDHLYLKKKDLDEFLDKLTHEIKKFLVADDLTPDQAAQSSNSVHETVREIGKVVGFTPNVQKLVKTQMSVTIKSMGESPKLSEILKKLENTKGEYISNHSTITAFVACAIASQMHWASEATFHKLNLAAFLHDMTLDNNHIARCNTIDEFNEQPWGPEEAKKFREHPADAAEIVRGFTEVPPDVDQIILQHHERPDQSGFPRGIGGAYISPLSQVFLIAHELAQFHLKYSGGVLQVTADDFIADTSPRYPGAKFKKIFDAIKVAFGQAPTS